MEINTLQTQIKTLKEEVELLKLHVELKVQKKKVKKQLFYLKKGVMPFTLKVFKDGFRELWDLGKKLGNQHNSHIENKRRYKKNMEINDGYLDLTEESEEPKKEKQEKILTGLEGLEMDLPLLNFSF